MKKIRKAIIPAAELVTGFLPVTKAIPKEMLPILDKPIIQYIVEEAIASGIEDIIIVTDKGNQSIEDHFDKSIELENILIEENKYELLEKVQAPAEVDIHFIRQKEPKGLGHAVWCARKFIGNEPFAVLMGDDIVQAKIPCLKQLIKEFEKTSSSVIGVQMITDVETPRYGIVDPINQKGQRYEVHNLVEKQEECTSPSNLAIIGRYILTPEIFKILGEAEKAKDGEIQLTEAIQKLNKMQRVFAYAFEGKQYDVGDILGYILTTIEFAFQKDELKDKIFEYLNKKSFFDNPTIGVN